MMKEIAQYRSLKYPSHLPALGCFRQFILNVTGARLLMDFSSREVI